MNAVISVGRVSVRKHSKLHLSLNGLAHCGAGSGRILGPARQLLADSVKLICRRCWPRIKSAVEEAIHEVMRRRDRVRLAILNAVADAMRSPAEIAEEARMLAGIAAGLKANSLGVKPTSLAEMRSAHLAALQRDREEFAARSGQLELCEVGAQ